MTESGRSGVHPAVLVVDDEEQILYAANLMLRGGGIKEVITVQDSREVEAIMRGRAISCAILDLTMPYLSGLELLGRIRRDWPDTPVIVMTGRNEVESAVECMRLGAHDYIVKPVETERFLASVRRALEVYALKEEVTALKRHLLEGSLEHSSAFDALKTVNRAMIALFQYAEVVAPSSQPVLISGETGVGKELFARAIHDLSGREGKFTAINIAGLDEATFSDALFGHRRGAFTGADSAREGLIAAAAGGTLFLDEIGDLREGLQVKLLRLLQEHTYYPLGSDDALQSDARIIIATNCDLEDMVSKDLFRRDLYYRLRFHHIKIPPLRKRQDDIPVLLRHFVAESAEAMDKKIPIIPDELPLLLATYQYPGNVRELEAMVYDAMARHKSGTLALASFRQAMSDEAVRHEPTDLSAGAQERILQKSDGRLLTLKEADDCLVAEAMKRAGGNQGIAASLLGITRQALNKRLLRSKGDPQA